MTVVLILIVAYALVVATAYVWQRRLLYFPDTHRPSSGQLQVLGLQYWPSGDGYRGVISEPATPDIRGTVVVFHGNAGAAWQRDYYPQALVPLGYRVVLAEYPGYGGRPGRPTEETFVTDAKTTIDRVYQEFGGPLFLWGESLGAGVAAAVAADPPVPVDSVVLITPWDTLGDLAQSLYWYLPAKLLMRDRYDNIGNLRSFEGPVAVLMAERDEVIPPRRSSRLYESLPGPKRLWVFPGAGHNSWPTGPAEKWWLEVVDFVSDERP
ncbi:MAG: alpha/beta hydrolase [Trueperaceae bacterium]|nr:MAG: alpha/beta hydrolase [Trueperaceae bacterium]